MTIDDTLWSKPNLNFYISTINIFDNFVEFIGHFFWKKYFHIQQNFSLLLFWAGLFPLPIVSSKVIRNLMERLRFRFVGIIR
jgi:hypothetical protein